jgi:hypothetical protein
MSRSPARAVRAAAGLMLVALPILALSGGGCVEAESRFFVASFCPQITAETTDCEFQVVDWPVRLGLCNPATNDCVDGRLGVLLVNRMVSSLNQANNNDVETGDIIVTGYDVRLNNGLGGEETFIFNSYATIPAEADEGLPMSFQLIPVNEAAEGLLAEVNSQGESVAGFAGVRFYGRTTGGLEVETPEAFLPITFYP